MKNLFLLPIFMTISAAAQPIVQPVASGDYWRIEEYNRKLREFANTRTYEPAPMNFPSSSVDFTDMKATRLTGVNEINWVASPGMNVSQFFVEYSRNNRDFERAGEVYLLRTEEGNRYVFRHPFNDNSLVYYRIAVVNKKAKVVGYSPVVQLADEEFSTKIFPTVVRTGQLHVQAAEPYELMQVTSSDGKVVYQKALDKATGTVNVGLPRLATGVYFVRLLAADRPQHVQRIMVEQ